MLTASVGGAPPELLAPGLIKTINKESVAQAVLPIREMTSLFATFVDPLRILLLGLTVMIVIVSGIGILVSIYNSMSERRHEIAVMRALGAGRQTVMLIVLLESILLSLAGGLLGWLVGHALIAALSPWIAAQTGVSIGFLQFVGYELVIIPGLIALAALVGYLPAMAAYRTDVAKALERNALATPRPVVARRDREPIRLPNTPQCLEHEIHAIRRSRIRHGFACRIGCSASCPCDGQPSARPARFAAPVSLTFSEEIANSQVAVIAKLVEPPPQAGRRRAQARSTWPRPSSKSSRSSRAKKSWARTEDRNGVFRRSPVGTTFLIMGIDPPAINWGTPIAITERGQAYMAKSIELPKEGADRLAFFQDYLEDSDEMLARDAYDEFAKTPYAA